MKCYQMFLFVLGVQAGSDCLYIFAEHLAQWRPGSLGITVQIFFSLVTFVAIYRMPLLLASNWIGEENHAC